MDLHRSSVPLSFVARSCVEKHGWLNKCCSSGIRRSWRRRYCVLKQSHLFYFKSNKEDEPVAGVINLDEYRTAVYDADCKKSRHSFKLLPAGVRRDHTSRLISLPQSVKEYQFFTENGEEMRSWIQAIQRWLPRSEDNILDSVLHRLDYNKYIRERTSGDLRSRASSDSVSSAGGSPSLLSGTSSGEETPISSEFPTYTPSLLNSVDIVTLPKTTFHPLQAMTISVRRRMVRNGAHQQQGKSQPESRLNRRSSTPMVSTSEPMPEAMHLPPFDPPSISEFNKNPNIMTPTFGVLQMSQSH